MITLYSGTPGVGKSLHLASRLYHWMQYRNAPIIANFSCDFSSIKKPKGQFIYIDNSQLTPERLIWFSKNYEQYIGRRPREGEILLVIDEAQLLFNSREWVKTDRAEWCAFFTQHRKLGFVAVKVWYPMKEKVGSEFFVYKKRFSDIYDTYALFAIPK